MLSYMNNILYTLLILFIIILSILIIILFFMKFDESNNLNEYNLKIIKGDGKNMNLCMKDCIRGVCNHNSKNKNSCKTDIQCNYCQDPKTNMFYVNTNNGIPIIQYS